MDAPHTKHGTSKRAYHFVWCAKYRKKILVGKLATFLEQEIPRICQASAWTIGALSVQADHAHLFLSAPPSVSPSQIAHTLKGTTARRVFQPYPLVKKQLWGGAFWSRSYSVGSLGDMSVDTGLKYIESGQDGREIRRSAVTTSSGRMPTPIAPDEAECYRKAQAQQEYLRRGVPA